MPRKKPRKPPRKAPRKKADRPSRKDKAYRARRITSFMGTERLEGIQQLDDWKELVKRITELLNDLPPTINGLPTRIWFIGSFQANTLIDSLKDQLDKVAELHWLVFGTRPRMDLKMMKSWLATLTKAELAQIQVKRPTRK